MGLVAGFVFGFPGHEFGELGDGVAVFVEDGVEAFGEGHFDVAFARDVDDAFAGGHSFDDADDGVEDVGGFFALADALAEGAVAAFGGEAGGDEVSEAGEAGEGFGLCSECDAEAGDFDESAGEEGGFGVVAGAHAVEDTGGDGDDVFESAGEFDAEEVVVAVDAKVTGGEEVLDLAGEGFVGEEGVGVGAGALGGDNHGCGEFEGEFTGDVWAGEGGDGAVAEDFADDFGGAVEGGDFDAFGDGDDGDVRGYVGLELGEGGADELGGDGAEDEGGAGEGGDGVGVEEEVVGEGDVGEVALVFVGGVHLGEAGGVAAPEGDGVGGLGGWILWRRFGSRRWPLRRRRWW